MGFTESNPIMVPPSVNCPVIIAPLSSHVIPVSFCK